jgi:ribosomal protein S18 acetylase RimI-like enzyme
MTEVHYSYGGSERLDEIGPLWERLNALHVTLCPQFADRFAPGTFADRKKGLLTKARRADLRVDTARTPDGNLVGYCVSTVDEDRAGEIESIFVEEASRSSGIGTCLMKRATVWMDAQGAEHLRVVVVAGNERAHAFYARAGFHAASAQLVRKGTTRGTVP